MPTSSLGLFPFSAPSIFYRKSPGDEDVVVPFVFLAPRLLLKCGGSTQSRVRWSAFKGRLFRLTVPPNPSVLVRPNHPDLWKNASNKVWLWGLLKTCSYPLRTYAWFLLCPCLLTRMDSEDMANSLINDPWASWMLRKVLQGYPSSRLAGSGLF